MPSGARSGQGVSAPGKGGLASLAPWLAAGAVLLSGPRSFAKEEYLEKVKFELLTHSLRCTTCHLDDKGKDLTRYGQRLNALGTATSVQERVRRMERRVSPTLARMEPGAEDDRVDIDGDGALNWVEILCGTDPSDPNSAPPRSCDSGGVPAASDPASQGPSADQAGESRTLRSRVEAIVDCRLCHLSVDTTGREEKAPHNPFGEAIARLDPPPAHARPGARTPVAPREPSDFLSRFKRIAQQDLDRDKVRNWDEIATFHHPADKSDFPTPEEIQAIQSLFQAVRRNDVGFGKHHKE